MLVTMPERDENEQAVQNVEKATDSEPVKGEEVHIPTSYEVVSSC